MNWQQDLSFCWLRKNVFHFGWLQNENFVRDFLITDWPLNVDIYWSYHFQFRNMSQYIERTVLWELSGLWKLKAEATLQIFFCICIMIWKRESWEEWWNDILDNEVSDCGRMRAVRTCWCSSQLLMQHLEREAEHFIIALSFSAIFGEGL